jgi:YfiH family protein
MQLHQINAIRYGTFKCLDEQSGLRHAVFTRAGGVSPDPWASLNQGGTVGDDREHVIENRRRAFEAMELEVSSIFDVWQVHGIDYICATQPRPLDEPHKKADIILTQKTDITLFMRFADCVPILFFDPVTRGIALSHAGWQGTVQKVPMHTVEAMRSQFGSKPSDIIACIGPSIGPDHYEVRYDVIGQVENAFGPRSKELLPGHDGKTYFNLWKANEITLLESGVSKIEIAGICTACHTEDWYSHRAELGKTGRFGALITLLD